MGSDFLRAYWAFICFTQGFNLVAAAICLISTYLILRACQVERIQALTGIATLGANPIFIILSASFMTDVPFLACLSSVSLCFARYLIDKSAPWLLMATLLSGLAMVFV